MGRSLFLWRDVSGYERAQERRTEEGEEAMMALMVQFPDICCQPGLSPGAWRTASSSQPQTHATLTQIAKLKVSAKPSSALCSLGSQPKHSN